LNLPFLIFTILQDYIYTFACGASTRFQVTAFPCGALRSLIGHTALDRTHMDEWSARRRDLTTHYTHKRQTSMPPAGFEPTITPSERPLWSVVLY